jgi:hypothetical protein
MRSKVKKRTNKITANSLGAYTSNAHNETNHSNVVASNTTATQHHSETNPELAYLLTDITHADAAVRTLGPPPDVEITLTKKIALPLIEYSFSFGEMKSATSPYAHSKYPRLGANIQVKTSSGSYTTIASVGALDPTGEVLNGGAIPSYGFGYTLGYSSNYFPVNMRCIHDSALNIGDNVKLIIASTDVIQCRIKDIILTVREME